MRWLALSVEADVEAVEAVSEIFCRLGRGSVIEPLRLVADAGDEQALRPDPSAGYRVTAYVPDDAAAPEALDRTRRALWHLQAFDLRPMTALAVMPVDDADWANAWREGYEPIRVDRVVIVPSWLEAPAGAELVIRLDPGMAFGTGLHPTTQACLRMLQEIGPMPAAVLDVGSGSGILGLTALRLGANRVVALDTDSAAIQATLANAAANDLSHAVEARLGTLPDVPSERFELVLANLVGAVLIELAGRLAANTAPGGTLIASGVIEARAAEVEAALAGAGFRIAGRRDDGEWVTFRAVWSS